CGHCGATTSVDQGRCPVCDVPVVPSSEPLTSPSDTATSAQTMPGLAGGATPLDAGRQFGRRYTIIRRIGSGGMADVYQVWDESLGTAVAMKLIRVDASGGTTKRSLLEDRFKRELK